MVVRVGSRGWGILRNDGDASSDSEAGRAKEKLVVNVRDIPAGSVFHNLSSDIVWIKPPVFVRNEDTRTDPLLVRLG